VDKVLDLGAFNAKPAVPEAPATTTTPPLAPSTSEVTTSTPSVPPVSSSGPQASPKQSPVVPKTEPGTPGVPQLPPVSSPVVQVRKMGGKTWTQHEDGRWEKVVLALHCSIMTNLLLFRVFVCIQHKGGHGVVIPPMPIMYESAGEPKQASPWRREKQHQPPPHKHHRPPRGGR